MEGLTADSRKDFFQTMEHRFGSTSKCFAELGVRLLYFQQLARPSYP